MALQQPQAPQDKKPTTPRTVLAVKAVKPVLVQYLDENGEEQVQLAIVGDKNIEMVNVGTTKRNVREGLANSWLREGIFKLLGKKA